MVNNANDEVLPVDFRFIDSSIFREGVEAAEPEFRSGCDCKNLDECTRDGCACLGEVASSDDEDEGHQAGRCGRRKFPFYSRGGKAGLLKEELLSDSRLPIYECHDGCNCDASCPSRVVGGGRTVPLQIFRTSRASDRGWGKPTQRGAR
jgi:[histone H3]-lysine9 N-trimethyltransferase SUV39H